VGTEGGIFRSSNNGTNWTAVNFGKTMLSGSPLAVSGTNLFAGVFGAGVFLSTDYGTSWTAVNSGLTTLEIYHLAVSGTNLFVGTNNHGVFRSTDNGTSWSPADSGLEKRDVNSLEVSGTDLFASSSWGGVLLSTNYGATWTSVNSGLPSLVVYTLATVGPDLYAGVSYNSAWKRPLSEMITDVGECLPLQALPGLEQNYPNPFNPSTMIRYSLAHRSRVTLMIYNTLGQQVSTLVNGEMEPGYHSVQFDAAGLASGVYFYRMTAGSYVATRTLLLIR